MILAAILSPQFIRKFASRNLDPVTRNGAGLAVFMKQLRDSDGSRDGVDSSAQTFPVCGRGGSGGSTSQANSSCVILNNSNADLGVGQDSDGNQDSASSTETSSETTPAAGAARAGFADA